MSEASDSPPPTEPAVAGRIEPLATLPVFFKLRGKRVVMAGGDAPAAWKAELLAAAGADVHVFAPEPCAEMIALARQPPDGSVTLIDRAWRPDDLPGAALAVGAIEEKNEGEAFRDAAKAAGVPVNVVDKPPLCDFQFGTIVARSPLVIGISTDGAAPVFGQALRTRIEALLPQGLRAWAQAAKDWRVAVQARQLDFRRRREFWERFAERALAAGDRVPSADDQNACFAAVAADAVPGRLILVGCGPGTADGITLQAVNALQSADAILADPDVPSVVVGFGRREATRAVSSSDAAGVGMIATLLAAGKTVAWVGTADPMQCGRWATRRACIHQAGLVASAIPALNRCPLCPDRCRHPVG